MLEMKDATGRLINILNDEPHPPQPGYFYGSSQVQTSQVQPSPAQPSHVQPSPVQSSLFNSPPPPPPGLLRSDSYDSNASFDPIPTPLNHPYDYASKQPVYEGYGAPEQKATAQKPDYFQKSRSASYEVDGVNPPAAPEKGIKRYPCRYRESHGCDKSFTTSGHASRHSKIHTAEKAVQCTYRGCHKKFTRADNMKQHLETHFKDKSRSGASSKASKSSTKRPSISSRSSSISSPHPSPLSRDVHMWDADHSGSEVQSFQRDFWAFATRPEATRTSSGLTRPSSGLDALAAAVACQERA